MKEKIVLLVCSLFFVGVTAFAQQKDYTKFVNPFIGTDGTGHTFPGACLPFGMVQPSPDNKSNGWDYTSGYQYEDSIIQGFSQIHLSGVGINEFGNILLQPFIENTTDNFGIGYNKNSEKASPGYYSVTLNNKIKVALTATEKVAFHQYTFPKKNAQVLADFQWGLRFLTDSLVLESEVKIENYTTISGYCKTKGWVTKKYFFVITFDKAFIKYTLLPKKQKENAPRYILNFRLDNTKILGVKVALSSVNVNGAKKNLSTTNTISFAAAKANAAIVWNKYLSKIEIEAPIKQKEIFYSSLYHLLIQPSNIADVDGQYRGADDNIYTAINNEYYSTLSLWDTYRAAHPLYTILVPERVPGFIRSMLAHHNAAGFLPIWTAWGQDNYCMIGNHAIPVIADAITKGFTGFDYNEALNAMVETSTKSHINSDWETYNQYGYYPLDKLDNESVSRTLESGYDDYCIAITAKKLGNQKVEKAFLKRAGYYKNLFDTTTKLMRGKDAKGNFRNPFNALQPTSPMNNPGDYTEANAWQYSWASAQYDIEGLTALMGGKDALTKQLNTFFSLQSANNKHLGQEGMIGQYAHGNEPSHHIAYLYRFSAAPQRTQELVHKIYNQFYNNTPNGITGNDDCGQMSAWYIFSTLGFYPVNPATGNYVLGQPQVKKVSLHLQNNKQLQIQTSKSKTILFNGKLLTDYQITHAQIMSGGRLQF